MKAFLLNIQRTIEVIQVYLSLHTLLEKDDNLPEKDKEKSSNSCNKSY